LARQNHIAYAFGDTFRTILKRRSCICGAVNAACRLRTSYASDAQKTGNASKSQSVLSKICHSYSPCKFKKQKLSNRSKFSFNLSLIYNKYPYCR
jgi:hypothetical protein